jgi:hypothetical protein
MTPEDIKDILQNAVREARQEMEEAISEWRDLENLIEHLECEL